MHTIAGVRTHSTCFCRYDEPYDRRVCWFSALAL